MAYEVTATRRRPQKFEDLVGQEFVVATLKNAIQSGKIAHAYLFSGPRGCGKTSSARILAKALNCENGPTSTPCEECSCCKEITKGSCLDVIEIDGASNNGINDVRKIKDEILFPPNSCRYKIYIIDEVHMLSTEAFNALLKTIEEPPEYAIFIFATTELHKVPATIKSRCQQFHFRLGSVEQIKDILLAASNELGVKAEDEALYWIARESTGSFRDAYTLFDQVVAFSDGHITYEKIRDKLGLVGVEVLNELSEFCVDGNSESALLKFDELLTNGISIEQFVSNYSNYLRSLLLIKSGIQKEALLGQNIERYSKKVLANWNVVMIERAISLFLELYRNIRYSLSPRYECELALSRLCWLKNYVSNVELKSAIDSAKNLLLSSSASTSAGSAGSASAMGNAGAVGSASTIGSAGQNSQEEKKRQNPFYNGDYQLGSATEVAQDFSGPQNEMSLNEIPQTEFPQNEVERSSGFETEYVRNNPNLSLEELKHEILFELNDKKSLLSSILFQTKNWVLQGNTIQGEVVSAYLKNQVDTNANEISNLLSAIWGKQVKFSVKVVFENENKQVEQDLPPLIKNICETVRGEVVSITLNKGSVSTNQNQTNVQSNTQSSSDSSQEADENQTDEMDYEQTESEYTEEDYEGENQ